MEAKHLFALAVAAVLALMPLALPFGQTHIITRYAPCSACHSDKVAQMRASAVWPHNLYEDPGQTVLSPTGQPAFRCGFCHIGYQATIDVDRAQNTTYYSMWYSNLTEGVYAAIDWFRWARDYVEPDPLLATTYGTTFRHGLGLNRDPVTLCWCHTLQLAELLNYTAGVPGNVTAAHATTTCWECHTFTIYQYPPAP